MPFKPGQSGNPGKKFTSENQPENKGRKKKLPQLDELLANVLGEEQKGVTAAEAILKSLFNKALKGDTRAAEILLDRGYGKTKQNVDITSEGKSIAPQINLLPPSE